MSRTKKTAINTSVGLICTGISYLLSFGLQAIFIRLLGLEYSGINSLFSDILKILNLADLGFNNAILFKLYKSIANKDDETTEMYLALYRRICYAVGTIVGVLGVCCIPFLDSFVKDAPKFPEPLWSLYIIILLSSVVSHFINYRGVLIIAKQERYIGIIIQYICIFLKHGLQIIFLLLFKNIYLYLLTDLFTTLLQGILSGIVTHKRYHLSWHSKKRVSSDEKHDITKDIGALAVFKFCRTINSTLDTFLISKFIAVAQTAVYGSTTIITAGLSTFIDTLNDGMIASIGDLNASGDREGVERTLRTSIHIMFLLYGTCTAVLVPILSAFCKWWVGYSLSDKCIYVLLFNFYTGGLNSNISTYRNSMGLYRKGWKRPLSTVIVNFFASYFLMMKFGIIGAFLGTMIANVTTMLWYDPFVVYKYGLGKSVKRFFVVYFYYLFLVAVASVIEFFLGRALPTADTFISLAWHGIVYLAVSFGIIYIGGTRIPEQKEILRRVSSMIKKENRGLIL